MTFGNSPICTDDFGEAVFACWHSGAAVWATEASVVGAIVPGVKARYVTVGGDAGKRLRKESVVAFHASERNCNTCCHLARIPHDRSPYGFLQGRCQSARSQKNLSPTAGHGDGDVMIFHPDDPMHMPCYESRGPQ